MAASKAHHESDTAYISHKLNSSPKTITFFPRGLNIVWGNDNRYWRLPAPVDQEDKSKCGHAELIQVSWLEVTGSTALETGKYNITFDLSLKPDAFGWNGCQVYIMAKIGKKGKYKWMKISLKESDKKSYPFENPLEIQVNADEQEKTIYFGLYEVWSGKWKGGLLIHKATITKLD